MQIDSNHFHINKQENNPMNYVSFIKYESKISKLNRSVFARKTVLCFIT